MSLMTTLRRWWSSRQARKELACLSIHEHATLARDLGLSSDQLDRMAAHGARGGADLHRFLDAMGLAPEWLELTRPTVLREMSIVCSACPVARLCRRDLERGWAPAVRRYCPNIMTIDAILAERSRLHRRGRPLSQLIAEGVTVLADR
ncbi:hypothetical protein [Microvirga arsenatis]|uniref:Uncharacterized protein n=1 Tax=Microvirga arsenatis TaxID=2692265 RepID=A0ABW9Z2D2_9HYPH|nr:hypothetical protein [Microvirga arsenatis]NBJ13096.1 hypothetical protein [Microvirga arsenatis]NBJ26847.1 hypothetical protein [Microvirga arsenatis]